MLQDSIKQNMRRHYGPPLQMAAYSTGLMQLMAIFRKIKGALILMYHSVADEPHRNYIDPANHIPAEVFDWQMDFLVQQRTVISLSALVATLRQGKTPATGTVVITFDDGYLDNLTVAAPILDRYQLPATLFLPTGYIDRGETQWIDQAYTAFKFRTTRMLSWGQEPADLFDLDEPDQNRRGYQTVCGTLLSAGIERRRTLLNELYDRLQPTAHPPRLTMTWEEVQTLQTKYQCFQIGAHTLEHTDLTGISDQESKKELTTCAQRINDKLSVPPRHFSFCYGRTSATLRRLAAEAGFEAACGGGGLDPVIKSSADLFRLPRVAAKPSMRRFGLLTSTVNTGIWRRLGR